MEQSNRETIAAIGRVEVHVLKAIALGDVGRWPQLDV
jgi:hypothetical protein